MDEALLIRLAEDRREIETPGAAGNGKRGVPPDARTLADLPTLDG